MSRQIVLDTETTGLNAKTGDRIIEIGCIELADRRLTDKHFHTYLNPERKSEEGALKVHGISDESLLDKPRFREISADFLDYIRGAELIIHNASFDVEFLDQELALAGLPALSQHCAGVIDTLRLAKDLHPGKKNSLDALCERYGIDNARRTLHGALLDAELLAEAYLAMTRGQESLVMDLEPAQVNEQQGVAVESAAARHVLSVLVASAAEVAEHRKMLQAIQAESKGKCLWLTLEVPPSDA